jgi:hypothetical protein
MGKRNTDKTNIIHSLPFVDMQWEKACQALFPLHLFTDWRTVTIESRL